MQTRKLKKTNNDSVTKDYLNKTIYKVQENLNNRIDRNQKYSDFRFSSIDERLKRAEKIWENVAKTLDWLVGKFKKFDEELTILTGKYPETNEKLESYEKRIQVLEKKTSYH